MRYSMLVDDGVGSRMLNLEPAPGKVEVSPGGDTLLGTSLVFTNCGAIAPNQTSIAA